MKSFILNVNLNKQNIQIKRKRNPAAAELAFTIPIAKTFVMFLTCLLLFHNIPASETWNVRARLQALIIFHILPVALLWSTGVLLLLVHALELWLPACKPEQITATLSSISTPTDHLRMALV